VAADDTGDILVVAERGFGKRTPLSEFRLQGRGGNGVTLMRVTDKTGSVAGMRYVVPDDDILLVTAQGMVIRTRAGDIRRTGRVTQGVKVINLEPPDRVVSIARLAEREVDGGEAEEPEQEPLF
jgi:DNA gyrase subunit A